MCIFQSFFLYYLFLDQDLNFSCRKISEAQDCDLSTLVPCSRHADYIARNLLEKLLKPLHTEYCTFTNKEIYALNVTYPVFANGKYLRYKILLLINSLIMPHSPALAGMPVNSVETRILDINLWSILTCWKIRG